MSPTTTKEKEKEKNIQATYELSYP